jgi:hypothetical protein
MNKIRREKPIRIIIHIYMGISQGNSLYLTQAKMSFFLFSSTKSKNRRRAKHQGRKLVPVAGGGGRERGLGG